jgi:hypothetical protein
MVQLAFEVATLRLPLFPSLFATLDDAPSSFSKCSALSTHNSFFQPVPKTLQQPLPYPKTGTDAQCFYTLYGLIALLTIPDHQPPSFEKGTMIKDPKI